MSGGSTVRHIAAVDALARTLYLRAKQSGLPFSSVAASVRNIHLALRHLRIEAADNDSLLNSPSASLYARQLSPLVEDCDFTLTQLESLLGKYGDGRAVMADDERVRDRRLDTLQQKLLADKSSVELFLDAVQLHAENRPRRVVDGEKGLEGIKDKVDDIATRLFRNRDTGNFAENEDELWQEFKAELEKEGFSPQVLRKHKVFSPNNNQVFAILTSNRTCSAPTSVNSNLSRTSTGETFLPSEASSSTKPSRTQLHQLAFPPATIKDSRLSSPTGDAGPPAATPMRRSPHLLGLLTMLFLTIPWLSCQQETSSPWMASARKCPA